MVRSERDGREVFLGLRISGAGVVAACSIVGSSFAPCREAERVVSSELSRSWLSVFWRFWEDFADKGTGARAFVRAVGFTAVPCEVTLLVELFGA